MTVKLKNEVYNALKWFTIAGIPPLIGLVSSIGIIYGWADAEKTIALISAIGTFLAGLLGISSYNYNKQINDTENTEQFSTENDNNIGGLK